MMNENERQLGSGTGHRGASAPLAPLPGRGVDLLVHGERGDGTCWNDNHRHGHDQGRVTKDEDRLADAAPLGVAPVTRGLGWIAAMMTAGVFRARAVARVASARMLAALALALAATGFTFHARAHCAAAGSEPVPGWPVEVPSRSGEEPKLQNQAQPRREGEEGRAAMERPEDHQESVVENGFSVYARCNSVAHAPAYAATVVMTVSPHSFVSPDTRPPADAGGAPHGTCPSSPLVRGAVPAVSVRGPRVPAFSSSNNLRAVCPPRRCRPRRGSWCPSRPHLQGVLI